MPHFMFKPPAPPTRPAARLPFHFLLVAFLLTLSGCSTPTDVVHPIHVAGGRVIDIPFGPNGPLPGRANGYEVVYATIGPGPTDREIIYRFAVKIPAGAKPQNIKVDDISDERAYPLINDLQPWLTDNVWHIETLPIKSDDPRLAWVLNIMVSVRVYRFTIIDDTGRRSVLYQVSSYPDFFKSSVRRKWGEKY